LSNVTRRFALGALIAAFPVAAIARPHRPRAEEGGVAVDVTPLRRYGDNTDADFLEAVLPGYLRQSFGPGRFVRVRIDSVTYGPPGSDGNSHGINAIDTIEGVGFAGGEEVPLTCTVIATVFLPDIGGYNARLRQDTLARSFAQWLPRQMGL